MSYSKSALLNLSNCKILWKMKISKFGTKSALFGYFWVRILKNYCHIWNQHLWISVTASFCEKTTMPKFGTKNTLFGYFWARILKKLLSYLKSAFSNLSDCKNFAKKQKCLNLGTKMCNSGIFGLEFLKNIVIFEISTLEFV